MAVNTIGILIGIVWLLVQLAIIGAIIYLFVLIVKALKKYIGSKEVREEKREMRASLGEVLREERTRCKMTQEFVAESLGVSRQAISKWENGNAEPSTSNLLALANCMASVQRRFWRVWRKRTTDRFGVRRWPDAFFVVRNMVLTVGDNFRRFYHSCVSYDRISTKTDLWPEVWV